MSGKMNWDYYSKFQDKSHNKSLDNSSDMDATKIYLKQVSKSVLLTHDQEISLSQQIENSKKEIFNHLFEIPMAVKNFETVVSNILSDNETISKIFDIEDDTTEFLQSLASLQKEIETYKLKEFNDVDLKMSIAHKISELPVTLSFFEQMTMPFFEMSKDITHVQGEYMRFAQSNGISRELFLKCYSSSINDPTWTNFVTKHSDIVKTFNERLNHFYQMSGLSK